MKLYFIVCYSLVFFKLSWANAPVQFDQWVIWNVGQGQWVTHVQSLECKHYDFGGELGSFRRIRSTLLNHCAYKQNQLYLSHWDYDHFLNLPFLVKAVPNVCWVSQPPLTEMKKSALKILELKIPFCKNSNPTSLQKWVPEKFRSTNDASIVYVDGAVLLAGDSPIAQEKKWLSKFAKLKNIKVLVLGHHGSSTSTGRKLLTKLSRLQMAVASARNSRYGHPHKLTMKRLHQFNTPVLKTEDLGNIWFQF